MSKSESEIQSEVLESIDLDDPKSVAVVLLNDDYSPFDFVVEVLMRFFAKGRSEAEGLTVKIHREGKAVAGLYTPEIAETKAHQVVTLARSRGYPLRAVVERDG